MRPVMMTGGFGARPRGINRSDKAKERDREQDGFCHNDFGLSLLFLPALPIFLPGLFETDSKIFDAMRN
jgi:hypothetical protein